MFYPISCLSYVNNVKLGYDDHSYNEFTFKTDSNLFQFGTQMTNYNVNPQGYNESRQQRTFFPGSIVFVITEFDSIFFERLQASGKKIGIVYFCFLLITLPHRTLASANKTFKFWLQLSNRGSTTKSSSFKRSGS